MNNILRLIERSRPLLEDDMKKFEARTSSLVSSSRFLILGGAGSIGQAVTKEIFRRNPKKLHVVDISENNLVELVRDIRSEFGYIDGEFKTFALDIASLSYDSFITGDGRYDYVLNLSALKHVRSEEDEYTLMRMIEVNVLNTIKTIRQSRDCGVKKYFCVSTDKAANPVNMMGASKRIMEMFLMRESSDLSISTARFANVAFSDGSLLHSFQRRFEKLQPIVAPSDVKRYFVTPHEAGELCLLSALFGENGDIFFPKLNENLHLIKFSEIAERFVKSKGFKPLVCKTESEARNAVKNIHTTNEWPCLFAESDTTGEKDFEEFFTSDEVIDFDRFLALGIIKKGLTPVSVDLDGFIVSLNELRSGAHWTKDDLVQLFLQLIPNFGHKEKNKYLDSKM